MSRQYTPEPGDLIAHELATSLRVPILTSPWPRWYYNVGIFLSGMGKGPMPTDDEIRMVASFGDEYRDHWYNPGYIAKMAAFAPFDIDGGCNGTYFVKYEHGGWGYQKRSWEHGARPAPRDEPMTLLSVMNRCHQWADDVPAPRWEKWKSAHPEVFSAVTL